MDDLEPAEIRLAQVGELRTDQRDGVADVIAVCAAEQTVRRCTSTLSMWRRERRQAALINPHLRSTGDANELRTT